MRTIANYWKDESGSAAAEYALILSLVGAALAVSAQSLGVAISISMQSLTALILQTTGAALTAISP